MLAKDTYDFRGYLQEKGIIFCYSGYITEDVLSGIGNAIKKKLEHEAADKRTSKGLFSIFVEQVQNVIRYSAEGEPENVENESKELRYGVLTVGKSKDKDNYFVSCGNLIMQKDVERLKESLSHIQNLDKDGLKALYKETLKGDTPEGSKGAGVGFIDIARRAENGFEFDFENVDDEHSYFCLKAYM
ncbi:MAG: hypothetical protein HOB79_17190 [Rhodospirillaceae bacterium]|nr:hypothetical protein [Rhodospirillales bacterium]MBT3905880.1 hypothetical protein [Rhodospirillaceae bacterium]MBT4702808.1 hypothetical protein [Rhodospirillaceae bacterium]MBT5036841.1 hypothetical protein [Rhodospirillaceae bacterium]MBT6218420.1 hypothetical protein [Rhodospirillaceae bacterium]